TNPSYFSRTLANQTGNLDTIMGSPQSNQEQIDAGYIMQNTRIGKWQLQGGVRYEGTRTINAVKVVVPISQNPFSIVTVNPTTGVKTYAAANTFDYVIYKWSRGLVPTYGEYRDVLPSVSAKYPITKDLSLKLGYNKA